MIKYFKMKQSKYVLSALIVVMLFIKLFDLVFDPNKIFPGRIAVFPWAELIIVTILGVIGLFFYNKIDLPNFINENFKKPKTVLFTIGFGLLFALSLVLFDSFARIGDMSVGLPLSPIFYIWGAISSEIMFRLFAISFFVWFFSSLIFKRKYFGQIYWIISSLLSAFAAFSMLMAFQIPEINLNNPGPVMLGLLGILVFMSEMFAFGLLKKWGFLSNLIFRLSFYLVWHITWPIIFY